MNTLAGLIGLAFALWLFFKVADFFENVKEINAYKRVQGPARRKLRKKAEEAMRLARLRQAVYVAEMAAKNAEQQAKIARGELVYSRPGEWPLGFRPDRF